MNKLFALGLGLALTWIALPAIAAEPQVGDPAPDFTMPGSDGKTYNLADFKDKQAVVIAWFPKIFTGGCTAECKSMKEDGAALRKLDAAYFTASVDPIDQVTKFAQSLGLDYPILADETGEVAQAYGVVHGSRTVPERWTFYIGADGKILAIDKSVNTRSHGADIAQKLAELGVETK